jgi:hypothetical protein
MKINIKTILYISLALIFLIGCGGASETEEIDMDAFMTSAVSTMAQAFFETQTAMVTPTTATSTPTITPLPTFTPFPTNASSQLSTPTSAFFPVPAITLTPGTPIATGTFFTATLNPNSLAVGCNNLAFVRDVTMPSGTVLKAGQGFTKTWKVQNTGTCDWLYQYHLVLVSGSGAGAESDYIRKQVSVWSWSDVSVFGTAPQKPGTYTSTWRMADGGGRMFGATLTLSFVVGQPTPSYP